MTTRVVFPEDVTVAGQFIFGTLGKKIQRSDLAQGQLAEYPIPWEAWRVWDAYHTNLPGTPTTDDLGLVGGTWATGSPSLQTEDLKTAGATNKYARAMLWLPPEYDTAETVTIRFHAGMLTAIADTTATIDLVAYLSDDEAGISADLCATGAQSINNLVLADKDFTITPTTLVPGSVLDIRVHLAISDAAGATAVKGIIGKASLLCDIRG